MHKSQSESREVAIPAEYLEIATICAAVPAPDGSKLKGFVVDARSLHAGLKVKSEVGEDFSNWIKRRLKETGAVEGQDFEKYGGVHSDLDTLNLANQNRNKKWGGKRGREIEYRLTLVLAKRISMMEGGEVGRLVQGYYIWCESVVIEVRGGNVAQPKITKADILEVMILALEDSRFEVAVLKIMKHPSIRSMHGGISKGIFRKGLKETETHIDGRLDGLDEGVEEIRKDGMRTLREYIFDHDRTGKDSRNKNFGREFHSKMRKFRARHPSLEGEWKGDGPLTLYSRRMFGLFFNDHPDNRLLQMRLLGKPVIIPQPQPATTMQIDMFPDRPTKH